MIRNARTIPSVERSCTAPALGLLSWCDEGLYDDAWAEARSWPEGPERSLIYGASLMLDFPDKAKDPLSHAARLLTGEMAERAFIWLSSCYWMIGEKSEARATLDAVRPTVGTTRFAVGLMRSIVESDDVAAASLTLESIEHLVDSVGPLLRGKFFNQRGFLRRRQNDTDGALLAYEEARYYYERVEDKRYLGGVANNVAFIYMDLRDSKRAHEYIDLAIASFTQTRLVQYLAHAYDTKAQVCLREGAFENALRMSTKAVALLEDGEHKETLARILMTEATALSNSHRIVGALSSLERAQELARSIASRELLFDVTQAKVNAAGKLLDLCDAERVDLALAMSGGSYRVAAKKLETTHPRLSRLVKKYNLNWNGNKPRRSIIKPAK